MIDINKDIVLYHGSRGGIEGNIKPISRVRCDFGQGFYLGENSYQAKGLVVEDASPYFYSIKLKLSEIPNDKILVLSGREWLNTVLANRKSIQEFNALQITKQYLENTNKYDVIIGPIADDRMIEAIRRFEQKSMTDKGLIACLQSANMGNQYVLKTEFACSKAEILEEKQLYGQEEQAVRNYVQDSRGKVYNIVEEMQEKYQRDGLYLNELIKEEKAKESIALQMEAAWVKYFSLPKENRIGISWEGEIYRPAVFDDKYLAQCSRENIVPNNEIYEHFWKNCVEMQGYTPIFCKDTPKER